MRLKTPPGHGIDVGGRQRSAPVVVGHESVSRAGVGGQVAAGVVGVGGQPAGEGASAVCCPSLPPPLGLRSLLLMPEREKERTKT